LFSLCVLVSLKYELFSLIDTCSCGILRNLAYKLAELWIIRFVADSLWRTWPCTRDLLGFHMHRVVVLSVIILFLWRNGRPGSGAVTSLTRWWVCAALSYATLARGRQLGLHLAVHALIVILLLLLSQKFQHLRWLQRIVPHLLRSRVVLKSGDSLCVWKWLILCRGHITPCLWAHNLASVPTDIILIEVIHRLLRLRHYWGWHSIHLLCRISTRIFIILWAYCLA
jgi:hypothetical protein